MSDFDRLGDTAILPERLRETGSLLDDEAADEIERLRGLIQAAPRQIAKILDEEGVKPPLRPQAWKKIEQALTGRKD
jgi:hypothetical protein